jgi:hypothetical protein
MEDNIISDFSINEELKKIMRGNLRMMQVLLAFSILYFFVQLFYWIPFFNKSIGSIIIKKNFFYYYRYLPSDAIIKMLVGVGTYIIGYRGFKLQLMAIENKDMLLFKNGTRLFKINLIIAIISFSVSLLQACYINFLFAK